MIMEAATKTRTTTTTRRKKRPKSGETKAAPINEEQVILVKIAPKTISQSARQYCDLFCADKSGREKRKIIRAATPTFMKALVEIARYTLVVYIRPTDANKKNQYLKILRTFASSRTSDRKRKQILLANVPYIRLLFRPVIDRLSEACSKIQECRAKKQKFQNS